MTWNHRIIIHDLIQPAFMAVHEVYYDDRGKITAWTADPIEVSGDSKSEILSLLRQIRKDINAPTLSERKLLRSARDNVIELILTCTACPKQYDAYIDSEQAGYLRLRHGEFRVEYPDVGGEIIYVAHPQGDGAFLESERSYYLNEARKAILKYAKQRLKTED